MKDRPARRKLQELECVFPASRGLFSAWSGGKQANCAHVLDANDFVNAKPHVRGKKPQLAGFYTCIAEPRVV